MQFFCLSSQGRKAPKQLTIALAFLVAASLSQGENMGLETNKQEHAALCSFVAMAGDHINVPTVDAVDSKAHKFLHDLNFTLSDKEWQDKFYKTPERKEVKETAEQAGLQNQGDARDWQTWKQSAEAFTAGKTNEAVEQTGATKLSPLAKNVAKAKLQSILSEADKAATQYPKKNLAAAEYSEAGLRAAIKAAVFGEGVDSIDQITTEKAFGTAPTANREAECKTENGGKGTKTALASLSCVCHTPNSNPVTGGVCTQKLATLTGWSANGNQPTAPNLQTLAKSCGETSGQPVTARRLRAAIRRLRELIHTDGATNGYLGTFVTAGCSGQSGSGACVEFTNMVTQHKDALKLVPWITKFSDVATKLEELETAAALAKSINAKIISCKDQATAQLKTAEQLAAAIQAASQGTGNGLKSPSKTTETDATCEKKGTGDACKPPCKEVEENGAKKCKLDKEEAKKLEEKTEQNDSKTVTTNTTASNSFVINKAPLLLAFLLF
uniref:Variant surface glycoprotein n=1 Tax=Trypanosoma brucei TaxID=5691 RepID=S5G6R5_9TRYP|nr:variant surface glycoprotein [Trypanosoma brucei]